MFMAARVNRLGVMNELDISFHVLPSRADILCVEVFCSQYLFKTFSDTRLRCVSHQLHQQPNGPVFKEPCPQPALLAPGRVRHASAPYTAHPPRLGGFEPRSRRTTNRQALGHQGLVAGSIETGSFHLLCSQGYAFSRTFLKGCSFMAGSFALYPG